jgi:hypothetical protein
VIFAVFLWLVLKSSCCGQSISINRGSITRLQGEQPSKFSIRFLRFHSGHRPIYTTSPKKTIYKTASFFNYYLLFLISRPTSLNISHSQATSFELKLKNLRDVSPIPQKPCTIPVAGIKLSRNVLCYIQRTSFITLVKFLTLKSAVKCSRS